MATTSKKRARLMPDLDDVSREVKERRQQLEEFRVGCQSGEKLELEYSKLRKLPERVVVSWLVLKYGVEVICKLCCREQSLPKSLTVAQRLDILFQSTGLSTEQVGSLLEFIQEVTPSVKDAFTPPDGKLIIKF